MSDVLLVGRAPENTVGKEFFLHCADWWYDILAVIDTLLEDRFPVEEHFERDLLLAPPWQVRELAAELAVLDAEGLR